MKEQIFETLEAVHTHTHTHTHTDIVLLENNKLENITKKSNVICHEIKEYVKN